jgi:two-component system, chemotaxis family, protein-glutamate methylesterase/glutaminase
MSYVNAEPVPAGKVIRVLVVDDSAFVRKTMRQMLSRSPFIEVVGTARDGHEALEMVAELNPDVITLDLTMPGADGLAFLREQQGRRPVRVLVVSMISKNDDQVLEAFELGALDIIQKPTALATEKVLEIGDELVSKVKACAAARIPLRPETVRNPTPDADTPTLAGKSAGTRNTTSSSPEIVVLGVSTGGPQALKYFIPLLPADFPVPIVIVLHMPLGYTELFARSLNDVTALEVREAREGERLKAGIVYLAPAGHHLYLVRAVDGGVDVHLDLRPFDSPHRPSVDVLFRSAAEVCGNRTLGIVMTGMGSDGTAGAAWIKAQGGRIIAEAEESCIVYGMPRSVIEAGLCDLVTPLGKMAHSVMGAL